MALIIKDRVKETAAAPGTGAVTLGGAVTGFQTFLAAIGNGNTVYYTITDGGSKWETGLGTYASAGNTLTRTTVLASSNGGSAENFTAAVTVWGDLPASKVVLETDSTWTPVDGSGAGLTLSSAAGVARRIGNVVFYWGNAIYPSTADGSGALIGGMPYAALSLGLDHYLGVVNYAGGSGAPGSSANYTIQINNSTSLLVPKAAGGTQLTNAQLSTYGIRFSGSFAV